MSLAFRRGAISQRATSARSAEVGDGRTEPRTEVRGCAGLAETCGISARNVSDGSNEQPTYVESNNRAAASAEPERRRRQAKESGGDRKWAR